MIDNPHSALFCSLIMFCFPQEAVHEDQEQIFIISHMFVSGLHPVPLRWDCLHFGVHICPSLWELMFKCWPKQPIVNDAMDNVIHLFIKW